MKDQNQDIYLLFKLVRHYVIYLFTVIIHIPSRFYYSLLRKYLAISVFGFIQNPRFSWRISNWHTFNGKSLIKSAEVLCNITPPLWQWRKTSPPRWRWRKITVNAEQCLHGWREDLRRQRCVSKERYWAPIMEHKLNNNNNKLNISILAREVSKLLKTLILIRLPVRRQSSTSRMLAISTMTT